MPFTFKLSKRLALLKASVAGLAALALACDRADLTSPQAFSSAIEALITSLPVVPVVASANDGNIPQNTLDNNLATRWSAVGDGQWIRYDLGALMPVGRVDVAWYRGNEWASAFEIEVSPDAGTWTRVFAGRSSGQTLEPETYILPVVAARYVRIVGHGQWNGTTQLSLWNSVTEVAISDTARLVSVVASANDGNIPQNTLDNNLATRWSAYGDGQWIRYDLGGLMPVGRVDAAWYRGNEWASAFEIEVSPDAGTWTRVFAGRSSGQTLEPETYLFPAVAARYVRIVGHGQWNGTTRLSLWTSITELNIYRSDTAAAPAPAKPGTVTDLAVAGIIDTAVALSFTEVDDGTGQPASYDVRFGPAPITWGSGSPSATRGTCATPLAGSGIGAPRSCTVLGLLPGTLYEFQFVAFRGTLKVNAVFGPLSSIARGTTLISTAAVAAVVVNPVSARISVGAKAQLSAETRDSAGNTLTDRTVTWTSSNSAVVMISANGLVTAVAAGSATITATSEGKSGAAPITVSDVPVASVVISPAMVTLLLGASLQFSATLLDSAGNILSGRTVTWTSDNVAVAPVSASGLVTGLGLGAAPIIATSEGQRGTATISVTAPTGTARHYYGAPTGNDANPCSAAAPCYTMRRISQLMSPGDTAHFAPGNYTWSYLGNRVTKSGTASALLTYISDTKWGAKIYGADCSPITNDGDYVQIVDFDVTGSCVQGITTNGNYTKIIGNRVHDMPGTQATAAIVVDCCSHSKTGNEVIGNVVDNIGPWDQTNQTHGIYLAGPGNSAVNNIVTRAASACIQTYHGATRLVIANNVVANCGRYGIQISADPGVTTHDYTTVANNIIVNGGHFGIHEGSSLGSHNVYNNNIFYNNPDGDVSGRAGVQSGTRTLTSAQFNALFVNYTGDIRGDYHLRSGAVAIDTGTTRCATGVSVCVPVLDFDGLRRPRGVAYDIGAFEF